MTQHRSYEPRKVLTSIVVSELLFWLIVAVCVFWLFPSIDTLSIQRKSLFWVLLATTLAAPIFYFSMRWKQKALSRFTDGKLEPHVTSGFSTLRHILHFLLWRWGLAFLIVALMNPRFGKKEVEVRYSGIDLMICLDVSTSMLAEDLSPNRLERSKRAISQLLDRLEGDRVGLVVFAGDAYVQLPITTDLNAAQMFVKSVDPDMVPSQGTAIGKAIGLATESLSTSEGSKAIIIISDGENHEDDAIQASGQANEAGVIVHTIGMGSSEGAPIPIYDRRVRRGFKKDKEGNTVISSLNEEMLSEVSAAGNGIFIRANNADAGLEELLERIHEMEESEFGVEQYADFEDRFQIFLLLGILCFILETILPYRRSKWLSRLDIFE